MKPDDPRLANLIPNSERTPKKRRENASKAGKASGVVRAQRKALRDTLLDILSLPMKKGGLTGELGSVSEYKDANVSVRERIMLSMAIKAAKGDVKAATFIRDTIGEMPVQELKVEQSAVCGMTDEQLRRIVNGEA